VAERPVLLPPRRRQEHQYGHSPRNALRFRGPRWSEEADNASHRDLMIGIAKTWMGAASTLERKVDNGDVAGLRNKLD
jgi:hypothetical protein